MTAEPENGGGTKKPSTKQREKALVYVHKLSKMFPVSRGWLRKPQLLRALDNVNFYIRERETFGLVGESGSGKSTLAQCVLRLIEPTVGRVVFDNKEITALPSAELRNARKRMQIVFQDPYASLNPNMTVGEIVREGIEVFGLADSDKLADGMVDSLLKRVGLQADMSSRYPHSFSGGQRQRIAIARALAVQPDFLVLDEPLSALDLSVQAQIMNLLESLQQKLGLTLLFISHDLRAIQYMSHRMAVMYRGKIVEIGPTATLSKKCLHPYTRALFDAMEQRQHADPRRLKIVSDDGASAFNPPPGCAYFNHCPEAEPGKCDREDPALHELVPKSHHRVACWHPNNPT